MKMISSAVIGLLALATATAAIAETPLFTASPTILVRSPNPAKLAEFYTALGFKTHRTTATGGVLFHLEGSVGSLEVIQMDPNTTPTMGKTTRTQQGVLAIFETSDQQEVIRRAKENGATLVEAWTASDRPVTIYYIGDPENNILGFAPRHHNPAINTP